MRIGVIIPAFNEEDAIAAAIEQARAVVLPGDEIRMVVGDNASTDRTAELARASGAEVAPEPRRGYGAACLAAIAALGDWPDVLLFCDADAESPAEELQRVLQPIRDGRADLAIGARTHAEPGSMTPPQRFGNWLAVRLIALFWRRRFYDLGPTRAIGRTSYRLLGMTDRTWGWTVEMQILAVVRGLNVVEVDVGWRKRRHGCSKISGTFSGVLRAGWRIMWTIGKLAVVARGVPPVRGSLHYRDG